VAAARKEHIPALVHVTDLTQPQGHSTSGSHERYKSPERLRWEAEFDCIRKMREWLLVGGLITEPELAAFEQQDRETVESFRKAAWEAYLAPILEERGQVLDMLDEISAGSSHAAELQVIRDSLASIPSPLRRDVHAAAHSTLRSLRDEALPSNRCSCSGRTNRRL